MSVYARGAEGAPRGLTYDPMQAVRPDFTYSP